MAMERRQNSSFVDDSFMQQNCLHVPINASTFEILKCYRGFFTIDIRGGSGAFSRKIREAEELNLLSIVEVAEHILSMYAFYKEKFTGNMRLR